MNSMQMVIKYWMKSKKNFISSVVFQLLSTLFSLVSPIFLGRLVGVVLSRNYSDLWWNFVLIIVFAILAYFAGRTGRIKGAEVSSRALYELRADLNNTISAQSFAYFDKHETGQLVSRTTSDIDQTEMFFGFGLAVGLQSLIQIIGVLTSAILLEVRMAWIFLMVIPISFSLSYLIAKKLKPVYFETRESFGELTNTIRENLIGAPVVRIFNTQEKERKKFATNNQRFYDASVKSVKYNTLFMPVNMVLVSAMFVLLLYIGGGMIMAGEMEIATLITLQSYIGVSIFPMIIMGQILIMYVQADAALTRVREVLESTPDVQDKTNAKPISSMHGDVEFENVSFGYTPSNRVLKGISFKNPAGKKMAILGTTGSGKSTIINLLPRFYDIIEGSIKIDGIDIRDYKLEDLRRNIGIVSQETFLFDKSIKDNIAFGRADASIEEIMEVAKTANLHEFIISLPEGYNTIIGERGTRLSGGQKQRLSIARALIIKPKILIFDDSTSSVDVETEFKIQQALDMVMKGTTTFIITQRISTIRNADSILVLDKGRVVGLGTHEDLINSNVLYKQIFETLNRKQKTLPIKSTEPLQGGHHHE